ncbi:MAG: helix-turn-helix transcriptional regulator [Bacilli bacterium]|nr:helix-turn-helix transcriptional regulator [Bacilli bacterium]
MTFLPVKKDASATNIRLTHVATTSIETRGFSISLIAERACISRTTLYMLEKGSPTVSVGTLAAVLSSLGGIDDDLLLIAKDDLVGRTYRDLNLVTPKRARRK